MYFTLILDRSGGAAFHDEEGRLPMRMSMRSLDLVTRLENAPLSFGERMHLRACVW